MNWFHKLLHFLLTGGDVVPSAIGSFNVVDFLE